MLDPQLHPVVFLDQQPYGDIALLDQLHATDVEEIRYFTGAEATQKFGSQYGGGVIQVISRQP